MTSGQPVAPDWWRQYWVSIYETPRAWAHKGENLIHAFEVLAEAAERRTMYFDVHDQALMLAGMACEVLLKSLLVNSPDVRAVVTTKRKQLSATNEDVHKTFYRHDLGSLAALATVALSPEQEKVAAGLSEYIVWRGRYVLPTEGDLNDLVPVPLGGGLVGPRHLSVTIVGARELLGRLVDEVKLHLYGSPHEDA